MHKYTIFVFMCRMILYSCFLVILGSYLKINAQSLNLITTLSNYIEETSGLIFINDKLITLNDSGGDASLYEIDTTTGNINREVVIKNASNIDWEDICVDSSYIYIADFGNNYGTRTDLKIYRILIYDYFNSINDTVNVDTINFSYSDQNNFTSSQFSTNFDAEAIISYGDSLYIFTKNWGNQKTYIYPISKDPGTYQITKSDSIDVFCLITGACYNNIDDVISLTGYNFQNAFSIKISQFNSYNFSSGLFKKDTLQVSGSFQIEGITYNNSNYYISSEYNNFGDASLYSFNYNNNTSINSNNYKLLIYPNPANDIIKINIVNLESVEIINIRGEVVLKSNNNIINVLDISKGMYFVKIIHNSETTIKKLTIK